MLCYAASMIPKRKSLTQIVYIRVCGNDRRTGISDLKTQAESEIR